jgi:NAD(P)-dependent dehydrogenase (short-subunit alcohol dehydrogenase family)
VGRALEPDVDGDLADARPLPQQPRACEEVAQVISFLVSPAASYVTGAQYSVGGGIEA